MARRINNKTKPKALVFAGPGESDPRNTMALLNDFIGWGDDVPDDDDTIIYFPITKAMASYKGMQGVLHWVNEMEVAYDVLHDGETSTKVREFLEYANDGGAKVKNPGFDAVTNLVEMRETHDPYLIVLWGEEGDEETEAILDMALANEIPALDLTEGLAAISFDEEELTEHEEEALETGDGAAVAEVIERDERALEIKDEPLAAPQESFSKEALAILDKVKIPGATDLDTAFMKDAKPPIPKGFVIDQINKDPKEIGTWTDFEKEVKAEQQNIEAPVGVVTVRGLLRDAVEVLERLVPTHTTNHSVAQAQFRAQEALMWLQTLPDDVVVSEAPWQRGESSHRDYLVGVNVDGKVDDFYKDSPGIVAKEDEASVKVEQVGDEEKPKRGRPRSNPKTITQYFDEGDQKWIQWEGRGRRPKDVKFRKIDSTTGEEVE